MEKLIIATDLNETSDNNVFTGLHFARAIGKIANLFHIDEVSPLLDKLPLSRKLQPELVFDKVWEKEYEQYLLEAVEEQLIRMDLNKHFFKFDVFNGHIDEAIDHIKSFADIGALSIGATHHGRVHRLFFNTFVEKLYFNTKKETLVVKNKSDRFSNIAYLLHSPQESYQQVDHVIEIAGKLGAEVSLICMAPYEVHDYSLEALSGEPVPTTVYSQRFEKFQSEADDCLKRIRARFNDKKLESKIVSQTVINSPAGDAVTEILKDRAPDLIVTAPIGRIFNHFTIGSITQNVIRDIESNFLLLPATGES